MYEHPANIYVPVTKKKWFITNPVHKTADMVSTHVIEFLTGKDALYPDEGTQEVLYNKGFATDTQRSLADVYRTIPPEPNAEIAVGIALTYACNLQCIYCFQREVYNMCRGSLDAGKVEQVVHAIDALKKRFLVFSSRDMVIELTGGEPLLPASQKTIEELLESLAHENRVIITTNGTHVADCVDILSSYPVKLKVTIDGPPTVHNRRRNTKTNQGSYHDIVKGIEKARKAGVPVAIKVTIDPGNADSLCDLVDYFNRYGWTEDNTITVGLGRVGKTPHYTSVWTEAEYVEYMCRYLEKHHLTAYFDTVFPRLNYFTDVISGKEPKTSIYRCRIDRSFFFSPDGKIYPCIVMDKYCIGQFSPEVSLYEDQIEPLTSRTIHCIPMCQQCRYALVCGGGCAAESLEQYKSLYHPVCEDYPRILKTYIPYLLRNLPEDTQSRITH